MAKKSKKNTIKASELKTKSKVELLEMIKKAQEELVKLRMDLKVGKLTNVHSPKKKRKEIARIKTIIREKELAEEK